MALNLKFKTVQGKQFELSFEDSTPVGAGLPTAVAADVASAAHTAHCRLAEHLSPTLPLA